MIPNISQNTNYYKIFDFIRDGVSTSDALTIDHKKDVTIRFAEKNIYDTKGFKTSIEIYETSTVSIDPTTLVKTISYNNLIKKINLTYEVGIDSALKSRSETFSFYRKDDSFDQVGNTKIQYYTSEESIKEGVRRRHNIVDKLKADIIGSILLTGEETNVVDAEEKGKPIVSALSNELNSFVEAETIAEFSNAIQNLTGFDWLDNIIPSAGVSIRTYIISIIQNASL